jgi:hypothetical protein
VLLSPSIVVPGVAASEGHIDPHEIVALPPQGTFPAIRHLDSLLVPAYWVHVIEPS